MKAWQPFIVVENPYAGSANIETHMVVLRVKDSKDLEFSEGTEINCYKEAHELNRRLRISLSDFVEGKE
jgi:hypothetical protein